MNIQKDDIQNKPKMPNINTPSSPMTGQNILITTSCCIFVMISICLILLNYFTTNKIVTPIRSYMLILISFCFLIFLTFSLINPSGIDLENIFQVVYYVFLFCGILGLVGFICFLFIMFFGLLGIIELIEDIFIMFIRWIIFILFSFLCLFYTRKILDYYNTKTKELKEVSFPLSLIYYIVYTKECFEKYIFTTLFVVIQFIPDTLRFLLYLYTNK